MSWLIWLRVVAVTVVLVPFVQAATRFWAERTQTGGRHLRVLESCSLGSDGRLYLVEVAGRVYALASAGKGVRVLTEVEAPEVLAALNRGEGVRAETLGLTETLLRGWAAAVTAVRRFLGRRGKRTESLSRGEDKRGEALLVLEEQLRRVRRLAKAGEETLGTPRA